MTLDRKIAELEVAEGDRRFDLIGEFVRQDASMVMSASESLLSSEKANERALGAEILGQLATVASEKRIPAGSALTAVLSTEADPGVIAAIITALGHTGHESATVPVARFSSHEDTAVRFAVAFALPALGMDELSLGTLQVLSKDPDPEVRNWATFGLAESEVNDEATRTALLARIDDPFPDARAEAIYGLARRRDPAARDLVEREMASGNVNELMLRARDELERRPEDA
jgi:HEAT repeat protein